MNIDMKLAERETNEHCFIRHFEEFSSFLFIFLNTTTQTDMTRESVGKEKSIIYHIFSVVSFFRFFLFLLFILYFPILQCVPFPTHNKMGNNKRKSPSSREWKFSCQSGMMKMT